MVHRARFSMLNVGNVVAKSIVSVGLVVAAVACSQRPNSEVDQAPEQRIVDIARQELARAVHLRDHVQITPDQFVVDSIRKEVDGGSTVKLSSGQCKYAIYVGLGHEVDVAGVSKECFMR